MPDPTWDSKTFFDFLWKVMAKLLIESAEREALVKALSLSGALPPQPYESIRDEKVQAARETIQRIAQGDENAFLALLRAYQGPVQ